MGDAIVRRYGLAVLAAALMAALFFARPYLHVHHVLRPGEHMTALNLLSRDGRAVRILPPSHHPRILNVFATWCGPCALEAASFAKVTPTLSHRGIEFVGIDQREGPRRVAAFAQRFGLHYPMYIDNSGITHDLLGARMIPTTILVSKDGVIRWEHAGPLTGRELLRLLRRSHYKVRRAE